MNKIYYARNRKTDYLLNPWEYRSYDIEYLIFFIIGFILTFLILMLSTSKILDIRLYEFYSYKNLYHITLYYSIFAGVLFSLENTKIINYTKQSAESENFYYNEIEESNYQFHKQQIDKNNIIKFDRTNDNKNSFILLDNKECKEKEIIKILGFEIKRPKPSFYEPIALNENVSILSHLIVGLAGSGKSVLLDRMYENALYNNHKLIIHAPDSKARDSIISSGFSYVVSAPWLKDSIYIDIFEILLNEKNEIRRNALIDVIIHSIYGYVDQSNANAFFDNGAIYILTATLRKLCFLYNENDIESKKPTLNDWLQEILSHSQIYQFKQTINTFYPSAVLTITEDSEKMTSSIIASMTKALVIIAKLDEYYKHNKTSFDLKAWCLDKINQQVIILCSDNIEMEVSKASIALIINLSNVFLLSSEREKAFIINQKRVYQVIDEFPLFAKNIIVNNWLEIINAGRKYGNTVIIAMQNTAQMGETVKDETALKKFIGSFHTQYITSPGSEEDKYINNIVGEVTYIDTEFQSSFDSNGRQNITTSNKPRKVNIGFKQLQNDMGFHIVNNKKLGLKIGIRLFESKSFNILFFPFVKEFGKVNRDKMRLKGTIYKKDGKEFYKIIKDGKAYKKPLHFIENIITYTKQSTEQAIYIRALKNLEILKLKLIKDKKLVDLALVEKEIIETKSKIIVEESLNTDIVEEVKEKQEENNLESNVIEDLIEHTLDTTGTTSLISNSIDILDELNSIIETEQIAVNNTNEEETKKIKIKRKELDR